MANNPYVNKVIFGSATLVDLTGTTATADKILEGYGAFGADGAWMDGTATEGGEVPIWQGSDDYVYLSDTVAAPCEIYVDDNGYVVLDIPPAVINLQTKTYTVNSAGTTAVTADSGYDGLEEVDVVVPSADPYVAIHDTEFYTVNNERKWRLYPKAEVNTSYGDAEGYIDNGYLKVGEPFDTYAIPSQMSVTPTESTQYIGGSQVMMEERVTVNAIPSNYVGTGITRRSSTDLTASGATVTVPSGYYSAQTSKAVSTMTPPSFLSDTSSGTFINGLLGTDTVKYLNIPAGYNETSRYYQVSAQQGNAGTPSATKGTVSNHSVSVTPSVTNTTGYITGGTKTGTAVTVSASELVSGTKSITENGTGIDVTNYASVDVAVSAPTAAHTVTISSNRATTSGYIKYNGTNYYASATPFTISVNDGDSIYLSLYYGNNNYLYVNDVHVAGGLQQGVDYTYVVSSDIEVEFSCATSSYLYVTELSDIEALTVTQNGTYTASGSTRGYSPVTVNVPGGGSENEDGIIDKTISGSYTNSRVTKIGSYAFLTCAQLTAVDFPNVTEMGTMAFRSCSNLTTASLPNLTSMGASAFYTCSSLTTVNIPKVTTLSQYAFYGCTHLITANFPSATTIGQNAFYNCSSLTTASFPNVTTIEPSAITYWYGLTELNFPNAVTIGNGAFSYCENLQTVSLQKVTSLGSSVFRSCSKLTSLYLLGSSVPTLGLSAFIYTPMSVSTYTGTFGSIYVPASLVNSYQTAGNWSVYSARITSYTG